MAARLRDAADSTVLIDFAVGTMNNQAWRHLFVSREPELARLRAAWSEAKAGRPQARILLGESGLGKTRLVQEFYRWLSREEDPGAPDAPEGYWPDAFDSDKTSLDVNPEFPGHPPGRTPPIPWLWWGLRWVTPDRRNEVASGCALIDYRADLEPHVRPIFARRERLENKTDAAWKTASTLTDFIPGLNWLTTGREVLSIWTENRKRDNELSHELLASPADRAEAERRELEAQVFDTFRMILDPGKTRAPTVPVVLFLDDAQWADPVTLRFVDRLMRAARDGRWRLLVLATHWEKEWREHAREAPSPRDQPARLADVFKPAKHEDWAEILVVPPVPDLSRVVSAAIPGATPDQAALVLAKAGGNPRLLDEILLRLLRHPAFFEGRDQSRKLTRKAEAEIRDTNFDYHELVDERFAALEEGVRRALGWGSVQGMRFLASVTEGIARRVAPEDRPDRVVPALEAAEDPYSLVRLYRDDDPGRFNLGEFRQAAFQHVARENLSFDEAEEQAVERALRDHLAAWLRGETEPLPPAEGRDALAMARRVFDPEEPETRSLWAFATAALARLNASEFLWDQARALACELADAAPEGWATADLTHDPQFDVIQLLLDLGETERARRLATALASRLASASTTDTARSVWFAFGLLGDAERAVGRLREAGAAYRSALEVYEKEESRSEPTPETLSSRSRSLCRIGSIESSLGNNDAAESCFERALEAAERLMEGFGETPARLNLIRTALSGLGDAAFARGDYARCRAVRRRTLSIAGHLAETQEETPGLLHDLSVALNRTADVELALGDRESALDAYRLALEIREHVSREYGETPRSLGDLSLSLNKVGELLLRSGRKDEAETEFRRALEIRERLVAQFDPTPSALRDLAVSLNLVADVARSRGDLSSALVGYRRGLEIRERIAHEFGETPESLRDLTASLVRIGDVHRGLADRAQARAVYRRGVEESRRLIDRFGETPVALRNHAVLLDRVGAEAFALGEYDEAEAEFARGLEIRRRLFETLGATPETLRDLAAAHALNATVRPPAEALDLLRKALDFIDEIDARGWSDETSRRRRAQLEADIKRLESGAS